MLIAQQLFLLGIAKTNLCGGGGIGDSFFSHTSATHENLGLKQFFTLARFTLHVVDGVGVLYVGVKSEDHMRSIIERFCDRAIERLKSRKHLELTTFPAKSGLEFQFSDYQITKL